MMKNSFLRFFSWKRGNELTIRKHYNEFYIVVILYLQSFIGLFTLFLPNAFIYVLDKLIFILLMFIVLTANNFKFNRYFWFIISMISVLFMINALFYQNPINLLGVYITFISIFIPVLYLINQDINYKSIFYFWEKISTLFTLLLPLYIYLVINSKISYFDVALLTNINVAGIAFNLVLVNRNKKFWSFLFLFANLFVGFIFGSRSIFVATVFILIFIYLIFYKDKNFKFYLQIFCWGVLLILIAINLIPLLLSLQNFLFDHNISSRNLNLFIQQLTAQNRELYLSGRDDIYPVVLNYLSKSSGFPSGLGVARVLTGGVYYHAHNFFLELLLTFGVIIGSIFSLVYIYIIIFLSLKSRKTYRDAFIIILLVSFTVRSFFAAYFLQDTMFILGFSMLMKNLFSKKGTQNL
ncbi:hypothetical protein IGI96_002717 [Enterococcus sp. DIV0421]